MATSDEPHIPHKVILRKKVERLVPKSRAQRLRLYVKPFLPKEAKFKSLAIKVITELKKKEEKLRGHVNQNINTKINDSNLDERLLILELVVKELREKDKEIIDMADSYISYFTLICNGARKEFVPDLKHRQRIVDSLSFSLFPEFVIKLWKYTEKAYEKIRKEGHENVDIWDFLGKNNKLGPVMLLHQCLKFYWLASDIQDEQFVKSIYKRLSDFLLELMSSQFINPVYLKVGSYPYKLAKSAVAIMHNFCHSVPTCHTQLKKKGAVIILSKYISHNSDTEQFFTASAIFAVSYLLSDDLEKSNFELRGKSLKFLVNLLASAIPTGEVDRYDICELLSGLDKIAAIDANKMLLIEEKILDHCADLLAKGGGDMTENHDTNENTKRKTNVPLNPVLDGVKARQKKSTTIHDMGEAKKQQEDVPKRHGKASSPKKHISVKPIDHDVDVAKSHKDLSRDSKADVEKNSVLKLMEQKILVLNLLFTLSLFIESKWKLFSHKKCFDLVKNMYERLSRVEENNRKDRKSQMTKEDKNLLAAAKKVWWRLKPSTISKKDGNTTGQKHILLSFHPAVKEEVIVLERKLTGKGFKVMSHINGNKADTMVSAIDDAAVFMAILSEEYKGSTDCRSEFSYAEQEKKKIIPVIVNEYKPDSWIKFSLGDTYWYNVKKSTEYHKLVEELERILKDKNFGSLKPDGNFTETVCYNWNKNRVKKWIEDNKFTYLRKNLQGLDGPLLGELAKLKNENQQEYYRLLAGDQKQIEGVLRLNKALSELHSNPNETAPSEDMKEK